MHKNIDKTTQKKKKKKKKFLLNFKGFEINRFEASKFEYISFKNFIY